MAPSCPTQTSILFGEQLPQLPTPIPTDEGSVQIFRLFYFWVTLRVGLCISLRASESLPLPQPISGLSQDPLLYFILASFIPM